MLRSGERNRKKKFYDGKNPIKNRNVNVNNIVISKLVKTKTNSKCFIGIKIDKAIRPIVFIMPEKSGYVKTFKVKEDKNKKNKLMSFLIDHGETIGKI